MVDQPLFDDVNPTINPVLAAAGSPAVRTPGRRRAAGPAPSLDPGSPLPEGIDMPSIPLRVPRHAPDVRIGCDVHTVAQTEASIALFGERYLRRVFTPTELDQCKGDAERLAARFAAKEAVFKLLRPGPDDAVPWASIEVRGAVGGAPCVVLGGPARDLAERRGVAHIDISLSHDGGLGMAVAAATPQHSWGSAS